MQSAGGLPEAALGRRPQLQVNIDVLLLPERLTLVEVYLTHWNFLDLDLRRHRLSDFYVVLYSFEAGFNTLNLAADSD